MELTTGDGPTKGQTMNPDDRPCQYLNVGPEQDGYGHLAPRGDDVAPPSAFIQWKGTDVCLDFYCSCGQGGGHVDAEFAYAIQCHACGRVFQMPDLVPLIEIDATALHHDRPIRTTEETDQ